MLAIASCCDAAIVKAPLESDFEKRVLTVYRAYSVTRALNSSAAP